MKYDQFIDNAMLQHLKCVQLIFIADLIKNAIILESLTFTPTPPVILRHHGKKWRHLSLVGLYPTDDGSQLLLSCSLQYKYLNLKYSTSITLTPSLPPSLFQISNNFLEFYFVCSKFGVIMPCDCSQQQHKYSFQL